MTPDLFVSNSVKPEETPFMESLIKFLCDIHPISKEFRQYLGRVVRFKNVRRKEYLLRAGHVCRNIYFVKKGLLLNSYVFGGKTITTSFALEGQLCSSFGSFFHCQSGIEDIRALEHSSVYFIDIEQYKNFCKLFPEFNAICRLLLEKCEQRRERRMAAMWMRPARERFIWLMNECPDIFNRIAGKHLCSYLGMTQAMLSRLKKYER